MWLVVGVHLKGVEINWVCITVERDGLYGLGIAMQMHKSKWEAVVKMQW